MGIDVSAAKIRAGQLTQYRVWLEGARKKMYDYKNQINASWSGVEVSHIDTAIHQVIASLDLAIRELDSVSEDVVRVANVIRQEEIEAEKQRRIQEASGEVHRINEEIRELERQKQELEGRLVDHADPQWQEELDRIAEQLQRAKREGSTWQSRLNLLRRQGGKP